MIIVGNNVKHTNPTVYSITQTQNSLGARLIIVFCMRFELTQITQVCVHYLKLFSRLKSTQNKKVHFFQENELKLIQIELLYIY